MEGSLEQGLIPRENEGHSDIDAWEQQVLEGSSMGGLLRSQPMQYVQIQASSDNVVDTMYALGQHSRFHIVDLAQKDVPTKEYLHYKKAVSDCLSWERKLENLSNEMKEHKVPIPHVDEARMTAHSDTVMEDLKAWMEPLEKSLAQNSAFHHEMQKQISETIERIAVLEVCRYWEVQVSDAKEEAVRLNIELEHKGSIAGGEDRFKLRSEMCGTLPLAQQANFHRMLYRITRGNTFVRFQAIEQPIDDPVTGEPVQKVVFMVVLLGKELAQRVQKTITTYQGTTFDTPKYREAYESQLTQLRQDLQDKRNVLQQTESQIYQILSAAARYGGTSPLRDWQVKLSKNKAISDALMKCHFIQDGKIVVIEGWCPVIHLPHLRERVQGAVAGKGIPPANVSVDPAHPIKHSGAPPTYFPLNSFTGTYQGIVDTYGVPRYQEVNPGLFTCVTFPFLFGVMYGDIGHGTLLTLAALYLIWNEKKFLKMQKEGTLGEIPGMAFGGRYVLVMMGAFGFYCGMIYNDCMSISINVYGSNFIPAGNGTYVHNGYAYPFGIDPRWGHSVNQLAFMNSFKMKLAVTLGVIHMTFGILLSLANHLHFRDSASIWYEFLPRITFMTCTFGYMIFLIIYKLCVDWSVYPNPPNLIQTMIAMFLSPGNVEAEKQLYAGQAVVQAILVLAAFIAIPFMLLPKPFINKARAAKAAAQAGHHVIHNPADDHHDHGDGLGLNPSEHFDTSIPEVKYPEEKKTIQHADSHGDGGGHGHGPYSFGDDMIHQSIHTIEFILGCVSNTASYLRLWALSLAHSELAEVFWDKMIQQYGLEGGSAPIVFVGWAVWLFATIGVLLCMDVLECFLHALRLHWVEFQSKFYNADGYAFDPFNFDRPLENK